MLRIDYLGIGAEDRVQKAIDQVSWGKEHQRESQTVGGEFITAEETPDYGVEGENGNLSEVGGEDWKE